MSDMDAGSSDVFAAALSGAGAPQIEGTIEAGDAGQVESNPVLPGAETTAQKPEANPQQGGAPDAAPAQDRNEAMVPSWRLREISEQRERERAEFTRAQRELEELRQFRAQQEADRKRQEEERRLNEGNLWEAQDPNAFIDARIAHRFQNDLRQTMDPFQRQMAEVFQRQQEAAIYNSRLVANQVFGEDKVKAAEEAFNRAAQTGSIDPAEHARVTNSPNQFEAAIKWHQRQTALSAIGGDLDAYNARIRAEEREAALRDPEYQRRVIEAHRQQATPVQTGVPGRAAAPPNRTLPSLNRQTSSSDRSVEGDVGDVFAQTIAERGRRAG